MSLCASVKAQNKKRKLEHAGPLHFERFTSERKTLRTPEKSKNQAKKINDASTGESRRKVTLGKICNSLRKSIRTVISQSCNSGNFPVSYFVNLFFLTLED